MPSRKQKVARQIWCRVRGFINVPPAQDDMAGYMAARRKVEKLAENPEFVGEARRQFKNFGDFLLHYDLNVADFAMVMDMDMSDFIKPRRKK